MVKLYCCFTFPNNTSMWRFLVMCPFSFKAVLLLNLSQKTKHITTSDWFTKIPTFGKDAGESGSFFTEITWFLCHGERNNSCKHLLLPLPRNCSPTSSCLLCLYSCLALCFVYILTFTLWIYQSQISTLPLKKSVMATNATASNKKIESSQSDQSGWF